MIIYYIFSQKRIEDEEKGRIRDYKIKRSFILFTTFQGRYKENDILYR